MKSEIGKTWRLLRPHALPRVPMLVLAMGLGSVASSLQAGAVLLFDPILNLVLFPGGLSSGTEVPEPPGWVSSVFLSLRDRVHEMGGFEDERVSALVMIASLALGMAVVAGAAQFGFTHFTRLIGFRMIVDLRIRLARHLMGLSVRYHGERQFGDLLSRVSSDVTTTLNAVNVSLKHLLLEPLYVVAMLIAAMTLAPIATIAILVVIPLAAVPISKLTKRVRRGSRRSLTTLGSSVQALSQMFQGIRTVKSFGGEEREIERYRDINESYLQASMKMVRAIAMTHGWSAFSSIAGVAVLVVVLGVLSIRLGLFANPGEMGSFVLAVGMLNNHLKNVVRGLTRVQESVGASERIQALLDEPVEVAEVAAPRPIETIREEVRFEGVSFRYPSASEEALRDVSLRVARGETLALVGPSGAGKSTLVDLVARFFDPSSGHILVDGVDLRELSLEGWTSRYALVGQVPFLFHASIGENIRYGRPDASDAEVEEAARAAGMHEFIAALPEGYATDVADMGSRLSGGQRQRITIARALLKGAPLLLLDEATSALDSESEAEVQRALDRLMQDRTVIVIAHRLSTIRNADRIAVLEGGRLVELGSHDELLARGATYARLHALQNQPDSDRGSRSERAPDGPVVRSSDGGVS